MALPTIILVNTTGSAIELKQLAVTIPASGSLTISDFNRPDEVLNDEQLQSFLDAGDITVTFNGDALTSEQSRAKIQPITALDIRHNLSAAVDPAVTDDDAAGYSIGSIWLNTTSTRAFRCFDDTAGAAVWVLDAPASSGGGGGDQLLFGADSVSTTTTIRYLIPSYVTDIATTVVAARFTVTRSGTLRNMYIYQTGDGNGNNLTYTLRVNAVTTALAITMASTANSASNTADTVAVVAGDLLDIEVTKAAGIGNSPDDITCTIQFD
jgi:hypothetical protein